HGSRALHDEIEQAAGLLDDFLSLLGRVALPEQPEEQLPRVVLHWQRLQQAAERDRRAEPASEVAVAAAGRAFRLDTQLQRRERSVLPSVLRGDLVRWLAGVRSVLARAERRGAAEPGARIDRVHAGAFGRFVAQAADDRHVVLEGRE